MGTLSGFEMRDGVALKGFAFDSSGFAGVCFWGPSIPQDERASPAGRTRFPFPISGGEGMRGP
jgi:hypothetical protein